MIKAIIFDLNGVFIQSPKLSERFEEEFGVPNDEFFTALKDVLSKARKPGCDDSFVLWKPFLKKWSINLTKEQFFSFWFEAEKEVPELIEYAKELKEKKIKIIVLSNNFKERTEYYRVSFPGIFEVIDRAYFSWQTGFVKPGREAYEKVLEDFELKPEECIYFDDSEDNIEAAKSLGIRSCIYINLADLKTKNG